MANSLSEAGCRAALWGAPLLWTAVLLLCLSHVELQALSQGRMAAAAPYGMPAAAAWRAVSCRAEMSVAMPSRPRHAGRHPCCGAAPIPLRRNRSRRVRSRGQLSCRFSLAAVPVGRADTPLSAGECNACAGRAGANTPNAELQHGPESAVTDPQCSCSDPRACTRT